MSGRPERSGATKPETITMVYHAPMADLRLHADARGGGVGRIEFVPPAKGRKGGGKEGAEPGTDALRAVTGWLDAYFGGRANSPKGLPLRLVGTSFQVKVWRALMDVPFGKVTTYGELAKRVGCGSARAVGQAMASNPLPVVVPCHRVISGDGRLGGFSGGLGIKRALLAHEQALDHVRPD